jgi:chromate reductase
MKVLAFAASNSRSSINKALVTYASSLLEHAEIEVIDLNDYEMPIYSSDRENDSGIPQRAHDFYRT